MSLGAVAACTGAGDISEAWVVRSVSGDTMTVERATLGVPTLELRHELSIGEQEAALSPYEFGSVGALTADSRGTVYVYDSPSRELRQFDRDGRFIRVIGRSGGGPGEYRRVGAMTAASGNLVISDPWGGRIIQYDTAGTPVNQFGHAFGAIPMRNAQVHLDAMGRVSLPLDVFGAVRPRADSSRQAYARRSLKDDHVDTLVVPRRVLAECPVQPEGRFRSGFLEDIREPYVLKPSWGVTPEGELVVGCPKNYRFDIHRRDGRVVRVAIPRWTPVSVSKAELDNHLERWSLSKRLAGTDAEFSWDNAQLSRQKPAFGYFLQDHSNRLWVWIPQPSVEVPASSGEGTRWVEAPGAQFDVFSLDGDYIGRVRLPANVPFEPNPRTVPPVVRGDTVWCVTTDSLGIERVARFRLVRSTE